MHHQESLYAYRSPKYCQDFYLAATALLRGFWVEHPPARLAGAFVLNADEAAVKRQVVPDRILKLVFTFETSFLSIFVDKFNIYDLFTFISSSLIPVAKY